MTTDETTNSAEGILIVDDAPNNLRLLSQMLEEHGYDVYTVTSGARALTSVEMKTPALILLDIAMPNMNGYAVCEALRANPKTRDIPVIFISALDDALDKVRAFEVGGVDYINKPFHVQEVLARVRTHLELRRAHQQLAWQNRQLQAEIGERARVEEQLRLLSRRLVEVQEQERQALAHELHEEVGQVLTGLNLSLEVLGRAPQEQRSARLEDAQTLVNELIQHVRSMSMHLRPPMLDDLGVMPALFWYFERYQEQHHIEVVCQHTGLEQRFPPDIEITIYRIVQEALHNVAQHAGVARVAVRLWSSHEHMTVQVEDQGKGFDMAAAEASAALSGLASIRERTRLLLGTFSLETTPGQGTCLTVELPFTRAAAE
jgi:signal transduction histidine kinase